MSNLVENSAPKHKQIDDDANFASSSKASASDNKSSHCQNLSYLTSPVLTTSISITDFRPHRFSPYASTFDNMGRGSVALQVSSLASNPYPPPKETTPMFTTCELCDRKMPTKDWASHKNSKKHRAAEAKEKSGSDNANTTGFGTDSTGFTGDTTGFGSGDTFGNTTSGGGASNLSGNDGWGSSGGFDTNGATSGYGTNYNSTGGGGGDRACYGCGQTGHQKRDCPQGGSGGSGGDRACYGCGDIGHQKRDCPKGGSGSGQACFNCGEVGYVTFHAFDATTTNEFEDIARPSVLSLASPWVVAVEVQIVSASTATRLGKSPLISMSILPVPCSIIPISLQVE
jgi:hypothetical protein